MHIRKLSLSHGQIVAFKDVRQILVDSAVMLDVEEQTQIELVVSFGSFLEDDSDDECRPCTRPRLVCTDGLTPAN